MMLDTTTEERRAARRRRRERLASQDRDVNVRGIVAAGVAAMTLLGLSHDLLLPDTTADTHHLRRPLEREAPFPRLTKGYGTASSLRPGASKAPRSLCGVAAHAGVLTQ